MRADQTIELIDKSIEKDKGNLFKKLLRETVAECEDAYRSEDGIRGHLGASMIGTKCTRSLWYSFRWADQENASGRIMRLWNRGHLEEARFVAMLRAAGIKIWQHDENGKQFRMLDIGGHFAGSCDGVGKGFPEDPKTAMLQEYKTHNDKSFSELESKGLQAAKPQHYSQMQTYMRKLELKKGFYLAVNKNTDALYGEIINYDADQAEHLAARASYVITSPVAPVRLSQLPTWYECKFCAFSKICHKGAAPKVNCRTCKWSSPVENGWHCGHPNNEHSLTKEQQRDACASYERNPGF